MIWWVAGVIFLAAFTQSLSGFGSALVAMSLLPALVGIQVASPLVAVAVLTLEAILLLIYRQALNFRAVWRLVLGSLVGVPLGVLWLERLPERLVLSLLGLVILGYALYALLDIRLPGLQAPFWAYLAGLLAGMLGGAYNTSGPPVILYADCRRWPPAQFKGNMQGFFIFSSILVLGTHAASGNLTPTVWRYYFAALPALVAGILAGVWFDRLINPRRFRQVVLFLLLVTSLRLLLAQIV